MTTTHPIDFALLAGNGWPVELIDVRSRDEFFSKRNRAASKILSKS